MREKFPKLDTVRAWLPEILFFDDAIPHSAPMNMAIDEALLGFITRPVLRIYRWSSPAVSFGCFERWLPIQSAHPEREPVRRWTGGGIVLHGDDLTYSVLVPANCEAAAINPLLSYERIHAALRDALAAVGIAATLASSSPERTSQSCFENPVIHDVLVAGEKVAGAAQRRTRTGLLHQGSIQMPALAPGFGLLFAEHLAATVEAEEFDVTSAAEILAVRKYGTRDWLEKSP